MVNVFKNDDAGVSVDILARAQARLLKLVETVYNEAVVHELGLLLQDLVALRMQIETPGQGDKRSSARVHERAMVYVNRQDGRQVEAALHDISSGGALLLCDDPMDKGEVCSLVIPGMDQAVTAVVSGVKVGMSHIVFDKMDPDMTIGLAKHLDRHFLRY